MTKLEELNAAVTQLAADVQALAARPKGISDAEIQPSIDNINSLDGLVKSVLEPPTP